MAEVKNDSSAREVAVSRVAAGHPIEEVAHQFNIPLSRLRRWAGVSESAHTKQPRSRGRGGQATILDLAEHTGLSKSVVSRALRGQYGVSPDAQARVAAAVEELGYVSNAAAQNLSAYRTNTIGVLVRDAASPFYGEMQSALQRQGTALQQRVFITSGALDNNDERRALEDLIALRVDGLIVCSGRLPLREVKRFSSKFPVVVAGRPDIDPAIDSVFGDEDEGARQLAAHLFERGHRRVTVLQPPSDVSAILHRRATIMAAELQARGAVARLEPIAAPDEAVSILTRLPADASAVMCPNDRYAAALLLAMRDGSRELAITGFDGVGGLASRLIDITTWRQPIEGIGATAVDRLLSLVASRSEVQHIALAGQMHIGRTTR